MNTWIILERKAGEIHVKKIVTRRSSETAMNFTFFLHLAIPIYEIHIKKNKCIISVYFLLFIERNGYSRVIVSCNALNLQFENACTFKLNIKNIPCFLIVVFSIYRYLQHWLPGWLGGIVKAFRLHFYRQFWKARAVRHYPQFPISL